MDKYLEHSQEQGIKFYQNFHNKGKIIMLNMLKFKDKADYTGFDAIKPNRDISGKEAYKLYMDGVSSDLDMLGSKVIFYGSSKHFLIGPEHEIWDAILLVEHVSLEKFMEFAQNEAYLKNLGHRTAALEDSRLLPITKNEAYK